MPPPGLVRTPDQRVRVFVSSTLQELAAERAAVHDAVDQLRLVPVMFELGARPHPPQQVYRSYLAQSQIFIGVYWQSYGWVAPGEDVSGLEDEYQLSDGLPRLIYVKSPAPGRDPRLDELLDGIKSGGGVSYKSFSDVAELRRLVENDLALLLSERFEATPAAGEPSLDAALPASATPLIGRDDETAAVIRLVAEKDARLVTLTGPGGVGKSRLAVAAADQLAGDFGDGVRFVDLAPIANADAVPATVAARLGVRSSSGTVRVDLVTYLRPRRMLLVLDNVEQVAGAAPLLAQLLAAAPGLVVLVTSRTALRIRGEHELPVTPLPVPPQDADSDPDRLGSYAAVQLFVHRARAAAPGFTLSDANAEAVARICRQLDGLPLALELAAARVRLLPPRALLARLRTGLSVLDGSLNDLPERQQTLRNTLDWSFGLLSREQQALFTRLAVFQGPFDLRAAEAVSGSTDVPQDQDDASAGDRLLDALGVLVQSSLARSVPSGDEPRFDFLETIRRYASDRLHDARDCAEVHLAGSGRAVDAVKLLWTTWRFWWLLGHTRDKAWRQGQVADSTAAVAAARSLAEDIGTVRTPAAR